MYGGDSQQNSYMGGDFSLPEIGSSSTVHAGNGIV
jgi:hypothetical protein